MSDKIVLAIPEIESLDEKELCMYARKLGIDLSPYAEEWETAKFHLRRKEELLAKVLDRRSTILLEEQMRSNLDVARQATKAAVISAIFAGITAITAIIAILMKLLS